MKTPLKRARGGFTLIEMMAVIVIIGVLAMAASPSIQMQVMRKQIDEVMTLAAIAQRPVEASWSLLHTFPADNTAAGLPSADRIVSTLVSSVAIENGVVNITFGNSAYHLLRGKVLSLRPAVVVDAPVVPVSWVCGFGSPPGNMTVQGTNHTNIDPNYLPPGCARASS